jgi:fucose 4-O-acetylase-like acetyltransferase
VKNRILWVDYAKAVAIFFVVMGHSGLPDNVRSVFYTFHIPLFFFLSGLFFDFKKYTSYKSFFKLRFRQIVVPYLLINIITYLFWFFLGRYFGKDAGSQLNPFQPLLGILWGNDYANYLAHNVPMWFLACLFTVENLYYISFRRIKNKRVPLFLIFFVIAGYLDYQFNSYKLPWGINISLVVIVFYGLGSVFKDKIMSLKFSDNRISNFLILLVSGIIVFLIAKFNGKIEVATNFYGNYFLFWPGALSGIVFSVLLSKLLVEYVGRIPLLSFIGMNTLIIYGFHILAGSFIKSITYFLFGLSLEIYSNIIVMIIYSVLSLITLLPVTLLVNKKLPILAGRNYISE